jgi:hypothetical protein
VKVIYPRWYVLASGHKIRILTAVAVPQAHRSERIRLISVTAFGGRSLPST